MSEVRLPALVGDSPLAILAAIGTVRLIRDSTDPCTRLFWDSDAIPVLSSTLVSLDAVVAQLEGIVAGMPNGVTVPGGPVGFPPPGAAPDKLRVKLGELRSLIDLTSGDVVWSWVAGLVTDLVADKDGRGMISQFAAPAGKQSMATMLEKPLELVRAKPSYLREALCGWRRVSGVTGEYLDARASWDSCDDPEGKADMRGVPGATWLALMSYPMWLTTAAGSSVRTSGWHAFTEGRRHVQELRLPLWSEPLGPEAIRALVEHPALDGTWESLDWTVLGLLGVTRICRARRRPALKSAGPLAVV